MVSDQSCELTGFLLGFGLGKMAIFQANKAAEVWISKHSPVFQFFFVKTREIVLGSCLDDIILRLISLQNHFAAQGAAPGTSAHLRKHLKTAFSGTIVRQVQACLC